VRSVKGYRLSFEFFAFVCSLLCLLAQTFRHSIELAVLYLPFVWIVEETAVMGVFCRRWGVPLIDGGTVRLTRLIGLSRALARSLFCRNLLLFLSIC
jgi:hypothetical protein